MLSCESRCGAGAAMPTSAAIAPSCGMVAAPEEAQAKLRAGRAAGDEA